MTKECIRVYIRADNSIHRAFYFAKFDTRKQPLPFDHPDLEGIVIMAVLSDIPERSRKFDDRRFFDIIVDESDNFIEFDDRH
jgi:hypothetical protein